MTDRLAADIEARFQRMLAVSRTPPVESHRERERRLAALHEGLVKASDQITEAIRRDYGWRSPNETMIAEIIPSLGLVQQARRSVRRWMALERRPTAWPFLPARSHVRHLPKGVVLILAPWNYPLYLAIGPLAAALAAGNRVVLKLSETTPRTAALLKSVLTESLGEEWILVATGGAEEAAALTRLPFDHILFTGSTRTGQKVLEAATRNLTPVTLELGGKSPVLLHESCDLALAARRIARGKLLNAGQTCVAPDYVLAPRGKVAELVARYRAAVGQLYPSLVANPDYSAIIDERHYDRLAGLLDEARLAGAAVRTIDPARELGEGEPGDRASRKLAPAVVSGVSDDMALMREEIFGPVLPIVGYDSLEEAIATINARPRPLAFYYFDGDTRRAEGVLARVVSGGATVNDTLLHVVQEGLPFGGIGASGMGSYHGREGFATFSHARAELWQSRFAGSDRAAPPYRRTFAFLARLLARRAGADTRG